MVDRVIARLRIKDKNYEIFVDCDKAMEIRQGKSQDAQSALMVDKVFKDIKKGEVAGNLEKQFGTDDINKIALEIIRKGEVQVSTAYREKQLTLLKNRIIDSVASMAIDMNTNLPIPRQRIEIAMQQVHHNFDINKPEKEEEAAVLEQLKKILPIRMGEFSYRLTVPLQYSNEVMVYLKRLASIKSNTRNDDALLVTFSVKAGSESELLNKIKSATHGNAVFEKT